MIVLTKRGSYGKLCVGVCAINYFWIGRGAKNEKIRSKLEIKTRRECIWNTRGNEGAESQERENSGNFWNEKKYKIEK